MEFVNHTDNQELKESLIETLRLASEGDVEAQLHAGLAYRLGYGTEIDDEVSFGWLLKAAEQGEDQAQFNVGLALEEAIGVEEDFAQAYQWYLKSAEQGHPDAQVALACMHLTGRGATKNPAAGFELFLAYAQGGNRSAMYRVASMYKDGVGVTQDNKQAYAWFSVAAILKDQTSANELAKLIGSLSDSEREEGDLLASEYAEVMLANAPREDDFADN